MLPLGPPPRAGRAVGPRARPRASRTAPTARTAPRRRPARPGRRRPTGSRRPGAGRRARAAARRPSARPAARRTSPRASSRGLPHDRDAEERVERQRQQDHEHPERVGHPPRHRVEPISGQKNSDPTSTKWTWVSSWRNGERRVAAYQPGEVQRPRRDHEQRQRERREGQHLATRECSATSSQPRGRRGSVRSASVTGAPSARTSGTTIVSTMCCTMCTLSSVVS